jgi:hypothetical protein
MKKLLSIPLKYHIPKAFFCWMSLLIAGLPANLVLGQDDMPVAVVSATKMNVLYLGVDNPLKVAVSDCKPSELEVTVSNGTITGSNGRYIVRPETAGMAIVRITVKGVIVGSSDFRVKIIPTPVPSVCGLRGGTVKKDDLLRETKVLAIIENFDFNVPCKVIGFKMGSNSPEIKTKEDKDAKPAPLVELISGSELFTPEQKEFFQKIAPGQKICFEDIKASCPDGTVRDLGSIILLVQ